MIRPLDRLQNGAGTQAPDHWKQVFSFGQSIAITLNEEHRNIDMRQVVGALG